MRFIRHITVPLMVGLMILRANAGVPSSWSAEAEAFLPLQQRQDTLLFRLTEELQTLLAGRFSEEEAGTLTEQIEIILDSGNPVDTLLVSDACYLTGYYYLLSNMNRLAIERFAASVRYRELADIPDRRYALGLSNMSVALFNSGDYEHAYSTGLRALSARRLTVGADSSSLANNYLNLASICLEMNDSDLAIRMAEKGLEIAALYPGGVQQSVVADLYQVIGLSLYRNSEYTKSLVYCREALKLYDQYGAADSESKQLILNTMSLLYRDLDQKEEAEKYFRRGLAFKGRRENPDEYLIYINYAGFLAENGRIAEGEAIIEKGLSQVTETFGSDSREYCMMMASAAAFAHKTTGDIPRALEMYRDCLAYISKFPWDISLKKYILTGYAGTLYDDGQYQKVIETVDEIIATDGNEAGSTGHSDIDVISFTQSDINIRMLKYRALNALAEETGNADYLRKAVETGHQIVLLYDRQRLEMSEEESRNNLSALSRDFYTGIIENFVHLHKLDNSQEALSGAFEYSERSKVAGFLASMRELNAARFSLPEELVNLDNDIKGE
ncbi:MAG: tetratricopeptide repeat protein, partial [Bacteroidales bacterium]|nr:tetratricopeptide repeat protein [Bacteroidales bacterium]